MLTLGAAAGAAGSSIVIAILIVVVVAFAWNLGAHYTGAVMGMPFAAGAIAEWPALALIGTFTVLGATLASGRVEVTVGQHIIDDRFVQIPDAIVIVLAAGALTMLYNYLRVPTSTIQILVFCVVGTGLAAGIPIFWGSIGQLAIVWVLAPVVALGLGLAFTHLLDLLVPSGVSRAQAQVAPEARAMASRHWLGRIFPGVAIAWMAPPRLDATQASTVTLGLRLLPALLVGVGVFASFVLGANDVANATGAFILTHLFSLSVAGLVGGVAMAVGTLTWGRRILHTVAFDVVEMDLSMASAAQGVQALVVIAAVTQGFFTSMNQALIGAMAGAGLARGRQTVHRHELLGILLGWLVGPPSGLALAFTLEWLVRLATSGR